MDRIKFLGALQRIWTENGELSDSLTVEDLLDDAATIGLLGATGYYLRALGIRQIKKPAQAKRGVERIAARCYRVSVDLQRGSGDNWV